MRTKEPKRNSATVSTKSDGRSAKTARTVLRVVYFGQMNAVRQATRYARHVTALALILLFGPAPLISLLAQSDEPQCQMACCKRKSFARSCALHHSPAAESASLGFHAASNCPPGCPQVAGAPAAFAAGVLRSGTWFFLPRIDKNPILTARASGVRWIVDSFLHQRPPPGFSS